MEPGPRRPRLAIAVLAFGVVAVVLLVWGEVRRARTPPEASPAGAVRAASRPAPAATPVPPFQRLPGRWQRPDGGYVLEIRRVEPDGRVDAAYFNPRPINVARAEASRDGGTVGVFIELRDVSYPGSTYRLTYDPDADRLVGLYFQAALRQTFDVLFVRLEP